MLEATKSSPTVHFCSQSIAKVNPCGVSLLHLPVSLLQTCITTYKYSLIAPLCHFKQNGINYESLILNWVCICNKHYDGYPRKKGKPLEFEHHIENEKLKLTKENFINDIELLIKHYQIMLQMVFSIAVQKNGI